MVSDPVRIGLIGVGRWGKVYLRTLLSMESRCRVTHLGTSQPAHAGLIPYPVVVTADWEQLISSECDAVIIATPAHTHAAIVEACVTADKPCMVEKPFCTDVGTAEHLNQRIQKTGIPILVNHTHLFDPAYPILRQTIATAGEPIRLIISEGMNLGPFRKQISALWDWCPHDFSLCLDLLQEFPDRIGALSGPQSPDGLSEQVAIRLDFPSGACAWIHAGGLSPYKRRGLSVFTDTHLYEWNVTAKSLTLARFDFSHRYAEKTDVFPDSLQRSELSFPQDSTPMAEAIAYFLNGIRGGDQRYFGTQLAVEVTHLLAACDEIFQTRSLRMPCIKS